jgi:hypothetical protein
VTPLTEDQLDQILKHGPLVSDVERLVAEVRRLRARSWTCPKHGYMRLCDCQEP